MEKPRKGHQRIQYLAASCLSIGSVMMGCYASWLAPSMPKFYDHQVDFNATKDELAWMAAISSPGFMAGSFFCRFLPDRFGRKNTLLASVLPAAIGTIIIAVAREPWLLYIAKFLWGAATGMFKVAQSIYTAEIANKEIRGGLSLIARFMFNFGNLLMMTIGPFVAYRTLNYMLLAIPVLFILCNVWIPESPYYLLKEGKVDAARKVLILFKGYKDEKQLGDELLQMHADVKKDMKQATTAKELFTSKRYRKAVIISFGLKMTQICTGQLVLQQYLGIIIKESNTGLQITTAFIIFGAVRFIVGVMSSFLADRVGRRPLLIHSYFGTFVSLAVVGLFYFLLEIICIDHDLLAPYGVIIFVGIMTSNVISTLGFNSLIIVVPPEIFPLNVKAVAMTSINVFGAAMNFIVARGYQIMKDLTGLCGVFWIYGGVSLAGAIFCLMFVPETKGKSFREIQKLLQGDLYEDDEVCKELTKGEGDRELKTLINIDDNKVN